MIRIKTIPYKWELIVLLWLAFFFNQADRQVYNVVLPAIRDDLGLSDSSMGLVTTVLMIVSGFLVPVAGFAGDKFNKKYIIIISMLVWSSATLATGSSAILLHLVLLRSVATGGGEAFYFPSACALIGEYHERTRATALSIHQTALYFGIICSGYLAGYIADIYGWRMSFYVFGGCGIALAVLMSFRMKDSLIRHSRNIEGESHAGITHVIKVFFKKPTAILLTIAYSGMNFVGIGFLAWMPTFIHEKYNFSLSRAGFDATFYHHIAAFIGVLIAARVADKLANKIIYVRGLVQTIGLFLGAPFIYLMGKSDSLMVLYVAMAFFGLCRGIYESNTWAALYDVIEMKYRAAATGFVLTFGFLIGAFSPYILGLLKPVFGLSKGLSLLSLVYVFSALCILIAVLFFYKKDMIGSLKDIKTEYYD